MKSVGVGLVDGCSLLLESGACCVDGRGGLICCTVCAYATVRKSAEKRQNDAKERMKYSVTLCNILSIIPYPHFSSNLLYYFYVR